MATRGMSSGIAVTCAGITTRGTPCKKTPVRGQNLCQMHGGVALREVGVVVDSQGREAWADFVSAKSSLGKALDAVSGDHGSLNLSDEIDLMRALERVHLKMFEEGEIELVELTEYIIRISNSLNTLVRTRHAELQQRDAMVMRDEANERLAIVGKILDDETGDICRLCGGDTGLRSRLLSRMSREIKEF